jgi:hypothetical protein
MKRVSESIKENQSKGKELKAFCSTCKRETNHIVIQDVETTGSQITYCGSNEDDSISIDWSDCYQIIRCLGCDSFSFRHRNWFSENQERDGPNDFNDGTTTVLYPQRGEDILNPKDFYNVPKNLRAIYKEVVNCFNGDSPVLCAAGLRATIEGICAEHSIQDGPIETTENDGAVKVKRQKTLKEKIIGLHEKGLLTKKNAGILKIHINLGNKAIHELLRPEKEHLRLAIDIIEHMLESIYEMPKKADMLDPSRDKINPPPASALVAEAEQP